MNQKDRLLFDEHGQKLDRLLLSVIGDSEMRIVGLLQRQEDDEKTQKSILEKLGEIEANQTKMNNQLDNHYRRIKVLEGFYSVFKGLNKIKKKTILIIGSITGSIITGWTLWEKIKAIFTDLFDR